MTNNAPIDELLLDLARWGVVSLVWIHNKWTCSVRVPGYSTRYHLQPEISGTGNAPSVAVDACFEALDEWQASGEMAEARAKAEREHASQTDRYNKANTWQRTGMDPVRLPKPLPPLRPLLRSLD